MLSDAAGQWTPWLSTWAGVRPAAEGNLRGDRARFHLGRGRRLRERGQWDDAAREARIALAFDPEDPWAYALLGQSLLHRERPHLLGAQRALRRACSLRPTNGYFVRLLLDAIRADGNDKAYREAVERAWWLGAPVERWLEPATRRKSQVSSPKSQVPSPESQVSSLKSQEDRGLGTWDSGLGTRVVAG